jgi:hypothetical protein
MRTSKRSNKKNRKTRSKKMGGNTPQSKRRRTETTRTEPTRSEHTNKKKRGNPLRTLAIDISDSASEATQQKRIIEFVRENIKDGIYIIDLPVPPERHAILIDVQNDKKRVMVSDWGGDIRERNLQLPKRWNVYTSFIRELENIYKVEYFEVDENLRKLASIEHKSRKTIKCEGGQGGCSNYIYNWEAKHCNGDHCSAKRQHASSKDDSNWENPF